MDIHRDVSGILNDLVLRDVVRIHGMDIPYPAELWVGVKCEHKHGTAMFSIGDRGFLTAEYFGYDTASNPLESLGIRLHQFDAKLIMKDTRMEIPLWSLSGSPKARTWHSVPMPELVAYTCEIQGWLGDPNSEMMSVSMTVDGLPDIHLGQITTRIPEERTAVESLKLRGFQRQTGLLKLEAGEWNIELTASHAHDGKDGHPLYHVNLSRGDGSPFNLPSNIDSGIINALRRFLSFQCGRWVDMPTIVCKPVFSTTAKHLVLREGETSEDVLRAIRKLRVSYLEKREALNELGLSLQNSRGFEDVSGADISGLAIDGDQATISFSKGDPTTELAWVGRIASRNMRLSSTWTATDIQMWPRLFREFWDRYTEPDSHEHLMNTVYHYLEAQRVFDDGSIGQALVAAQSTLQALTRWWNGLDISHRFGPPGPTFEQLLVKTVKKANLGQDSGVYIDIRALRETIKIAKNYRNDIDHGRGRNTEGSEQRVVYCRMHHHNLARLLILAKLGSCDRDARGCAAGPRFTNHPE